MPMLCQTRPLATLSAQTEPSHYLSDQARPHPRQDPPLDRLPCPTKVVILASVLKIEVCMAVCQLLAGILDLIGHLRTAASTPLDEATESRSQTSCNQHGHLGHDALPACAAPLLGSAGSTGAGCQALTGHAARGGHGVLGPRAGAPGPCCRSEELVSVEGLHDLGARSLCASE